MSTKKKNILARARIAIGAISKNVIDATVELARELDQPLMLIPSRNQIDCSENGGGYCENWNTAEFAAYVRSQDAHNILLCRDHCGPYFRGNERSLSLEDAVSAAKRTIEHDITAGFDLIHIDTCFVKDDQIGLARELVGFAQALAEAQKKEVYFEVGTDENIGAAMPPEAFKRYLDSVMEFIAPEFIVGQTGSLTLERYQIGNFNADYVRKICAICSAYNVRFKEHNCDYLDRYDIALRAETGVGAINIAPELGVLETKIIMNTARKLGFITELNAFEQKVIHSDKWKKWQYSATLSDENKFLIAGHYFFSDEAVHSLKNLIAKHLPLDAQIKQVLKARIQEFVEGMA